MVMATDASRRVPDLGGSFCDIWLVGAYVREQASLISYQYTIMYSFMLLTPHTTKNIGADNTKQQTTNHQHNGSDGLDATGSPPVAWCKGPTMPHL
jgi:hypothetical protein